MNTNSNAPVTRPLPRNQNQNPGMRPRNLLNLLHLAVQEEEKERAGGFSFDTPREKKDFYRSMFGRAVEMQAWGQNGALFITQHSGWPHDGNSYRYLYVNNRLRAAVTSGHNYREGSWITVKLYSPEEGEANLQKRLQEGRDREQQRQTWRTECLAQMLQSGIASKRNFASWRYEDGMFGGIFYRYADGASVAADGVVAAVEKIIGEDAPHPEEQKFDRALYGARY